MQPRRLLLKAFAAAGLLGPAGISGLIREALAKGNAPIAPGLHRIRGEVTVNFKLANVRGGRRSRSRERSYTSSSVIDRVQQRALDSCSGTNDPCQILGIYLLVPNRLYN